MPELKPRSKIVDRGVTNFSVLSASVDIPLNNPMPENANYSIFYRQISGVAVAMPSTASKTPAGFRASLGVGVAATFEWLVIED